MSSIIIIACRNRRCSSCQSNADVAWIEAHGNRSHRPGSPSPRPATGRLSARCKRRLRRTARRYSVRDPAAGEPESVLAEMLKTAGRLDVLVLVSPTLGAQGQGDCFGKRRRRCGRRSRFLCARGVRRTGGDGRVYRGDWVRARTSAVTPQSAWRPSRRCSLPTCAGNSDAARFAQSTDQRAGAWRDRQGTDRLDIAAQATKRS